MSIIDNLLRGLGYSKANPKNYPAWALERAGTEEVSYPDYMTNYSQVEYFKRVSWVNIAVDKVATVGSGAKFNVKKMNGEKLEDIPNHDLERVLRAPNPLMSQSDLIYSTLAYMCVTNNAYWWMNKVNNKPVEFWLIPTKQISPIPDEKLYIKWYEYDPGNGRLINLPVDEVVAFSGFNPDSMFTGYSNLESLKMVMDADVAMQSWNKRLFGKNNGKLPGLMAFADPIPDEDWEQIQKDVDKASSIRSIMMLRNVKAGGVQWIQAAASQKDMEFLNSRLANRDEIYSSIAPGLASILSVNATEANAKTGKSTMIDFKVYPMLKKIGDVLTTKVMPVYGDGYILEPEDIRVTDKLMELKEMQEYAKTHTVDELRERFWNDKPLEGEAGKLLVSVAQNAKKQEPRVEVPVNQPVNEIVEPEKQTDEPEMIKDIRPAMLELDKWERKAKKAGKQVEFVAYNIPAEIVDSINNGTTFDEARKMLRRDSVIPVANAMIVESSKRDYSDVALLKLADAINNAVEK